MPQSHDVREQFLGRIAKVHDERRLVQVVRDGEGTVYGGDQFWVTLMHRVHEIVDQFGQVREGMQVFVFTTGTRGGATMAYAYIIGDEDESGPSKTLALNDMERGFHGVIMESV